MADEAPDPGETYERALAGMDKMAELWVSDPMISKMCAAVNSWQDEEARHGQLIKLAMLCYVEGLYAGRMSLIEVTRRNQQ